MTPYLSHNFPPSFDLQSHARVQIFTCKNVSVCNGSSPNFNMFYGKRRVSSQISRLCHVHAQVHTLKDGCLYTFWITKSCLCVTLNISHLVCNMIFHRFTRNKVPHHDFLTYEPFHYATFDLQGRLRVQIVTYEDVSVYNVSQNF